MSLLETSETSSPFAGASWFELFSRTVASGQGEIRWLILQNERSTLLLLPMLECRDRGIRILKSLSNYYTPYFDCISASQNQPQLLAILFDQAREFLKQYDKIEICPLTPAVRDTFKVALQNGGFFTRSYIYSYNWRYLKITTFREYWSTINSRLKHTVKRKGKKIAVEGDIEYSIVRDENLTDALADYHALYSKSWKAAESHPLFIDGLVRNCSENGTLRLGFMHKKGAAIATQIWLVANGYAYIYKLAYDPAYSKFSVGTLLSRHLFEAIITDDKVHTIDYLTGDDSYKADWMNSRRELYRMECYNRETVRGLLCTARSFAGDLYKRLVGS